MFGGFAVRGRSSLAAIPVSILELVFESRRLSVQRDWAMDF